MKKLLLVLLFAPLVSFGQSSKTIDPPIKTIKKTSRKSIGSIVNRYSFGLTGLIGDTFKNEKTKLKQKKESRVERIKRIAIKNPKRADKMRIQDEKKRIRKQSKLKQSLKRL